MNDALQTEFAVCYYRWALDDMKRELKEGLPFLRAIKSANAIRAARYLESFSEDERLDVAGILVKRFHKPALQALGESWTAADEKQERRYLEATRHRTPEEEAFHRLLLADVTLVSGVDVLKIDRSQFLADVRQQLAPILGAGERFSGKHLWRYRNPVGQWTVETYVDVGGKVHQLGYAHNIRAEDPRPLMQGISILGWLGIGGAHTTWDELTVADTDAAARLLARLCHHFMSAAPGLLDGLDPDA